MSKEIKSDKVKLFYQNISKDSKEAKYLKEKQLNEVKKYAISECERLFTDTYKLFESNPNFWYGPIENIKGDELETAVLKRPEYQEAIKVLKVVGNILNPVSTDLNNPKPELTNKKTFHSYFPDEYKGLAELLKKEYKGKKGTGLKLMIFALEENGILTIEDRGLTDFYNAMCDYFDWNIGKLSGLSKVNVNEQPEKNRNLHLKKIENLLQKLNN